MRRDDGVSMNRDRLVADAKEVALSLVRNGYNPPAANWQEGAQTAQIKLVSEQYVLDLEREAFVSLCGEKKTQARIAHTLKTGKPLRN